MYFYTGHSNVHDVKKIGIIIFVHNRIKLILTIINSLFYFPRVIFQWLSETK